MLNPTSFHIRRSHFMALAVMMMIFCASSTSLAQAPTPSPHPSVQPTPTLQFGSKSSFPEQVAKFGIKARELTKGLQTDVVDSLMGWIESVSLLLMMVIIVGSGVREWHENNWEGRNLFWWFGRLAICLLLFSSSVSIIDELYLVGKEIAEGRNRDSTLYRFYVEREDLFNASYEKVVDGTFKVPVNGKEYGVKPIDGVEEFLGVTKDQQDRSRDITSNLDDSNFTLPRLFTLLSISRGVMELGDVWLVVLAGLLMMAVKVTAPFMVVLGIDRKLSQRTVNAYIWGLIVLTLIWPSVSYFIRGIAYTAGNLAMSLGDQGQIYTFDDGTQKALRFPDTQPVYTIGFAALMMLGSGLALWVSPFLAYSFSMGRVFEGVSQTASQFAGSFISAAMEWVSASAAARIGRMAENKQIEGSYEAERERARGEKAASDLGALSRRAQAAFSAKAQQISALSQAHAALTNQKMLAEAGRIFQDNSLFKQNEQAVRNWRLEQFYQGAMTRIGFGQQSLENNGNFVQHLLESAGHTDPRLGGVRAIGTFWGWDSRDDALGKGTKARLAAIDGYYNTGFTLNEKTGAIDPHTGRPFVKSVHLDSLPESNAKYTSDMYKINKDYQDAQGRAAGATFAQTKQGIDRAYKYQINSADIIYNDYELPANQTRFDAQIKAADITRSAGLEAANLRVAQHVISQVASKITRDIEKGIEMRF